MKFNVNLKYYFFLESLIPGVLCLKEIFHNKTIVTAGSATTIQNEFLMQLEKILVKLDQSQHEATYASAHLNTQINNYTTINNEASINVSPGSIYSQSNSTISNQSNEQMTPLSSASLSINNYQNSLVTENNSNIKSLVFKGINTFKEGYSKTNNLLTNKTFKK